MAKIFFVIIMLLFSPIWLPIMVIYGIIIGPIGYAVLFYQRFYAEYLYSKKKYKRYLTLKKAGRWIDKYSDPVSGQLKENIVPDSPRKAAFMTVLLTTLAFLTMFVFGIISGPIRAVMLFWRRMYFTLFPDEILKRS